jgi:hypothetical protein
VSLDLKWNDDRILAALEVAFVKANERFGNRAAREITADKWAWPSGDNPRDIVDNGGLRNSYTPTSVSGTEYDHTWSVDYAMAVHEGVQGKAFPARPWTKEPIERLPADFEAAAKRELASVQ